MKASSKVADMPEVEVSSRRRRQKQHERREVLREQLWPGSGAEIWSRHSHVGFATTPRLLPLIAVLIKALSTEPGDPTTVYFELWARVFDEGLVQIKDEEECAYASGYTGNRAVRTWRERMGVLEELGFIKTAPSGNRQFANILLIDPLLAVARIKKKSKKLPKEWWAAFLARADEVGAEIPEPS